MSPCVWAQEGAHLEIRQEGFSPLDYVVHDKGGTVVVDPSYPIFGYVALERHTNASDESHAVSWNYSLLGFFPSLRGRAIDDFRAVLGPLPVGEYTVLAQSVSGGRTVQHEIGPIHVAGGLNAFSWK
jgi:hypothetical protein